MLIVCRRLALLAVSGTRLAAKLQLLPLRLECMSARGHRGWRFTLGVRVLPVLVGVALPARADIWTYTAGSCLSFNLGVQQIAAILHQG